MSASWETAGSALLLWFVLRRKEETSAARVSRVMVRTGGSGWDAKSLTRNETKSQWRQSRHDAGNQTNYGGLQ
jgi:hypothetical protein